jgi:hypothetical protein
MGDVIFKVSAETAAAVQGFLKIVDAQKKVEDGASRVVTATKKAADTHTNFAASSVQHLGNMVIGWFGVGAAISGVQQALAMVLADLKRIDEQSDRTTNSTVSTIVAMGDQKRVTEIRQKLASDLFASEGVGAAEAAGLYKAVRGANPRVSADQAIALTKQAARGRGAGLQGEDLQQFANVVGEVSKLVGPNATGDEIAGMALYAQQQVGKHGRKLDRGGWGAAKAFVDSGMGTPQEALAMLLASQESEQKSSAFASLTEKLREDKKVAPARFGAAESKGEAAVRAFYATNDPKQRYAMIQADRDLRSELFSGGAANIEALLAGGADEYRAQLSSMGHRDYVGAARDSVMKDRDVAKEYVISQVKAQAENYELKSGGGAWDSMEYADAVGRANGQSPLKRFAAYVGMGARAVVGDDLGGTNAGTDLRNAIDAVQGKPASAGPTAQLNATISELTKAVDGLNKIVASGSELGKLLEKSPLYISPNAQVVD